MTRPDDPIDRLAALRLFEAGEAAAALMKTAADAVSTYALKGRLVCSASGWGILEVPNSLMRGVFQALHEPGVELPPAHGGRINAHISVLRPEEVTRAGGKDAITEWGHLFPYQLGALKVVEPMGWDAMSKCWFLAVTSPAIQQFRKSYGLTPLPQKDGKDLPLHLTCAVRRKNVLNRNGVSKAASLSEYDCPRCGGTAYNGDPETGTRYRGGGECGDCGETFSIVGMKLKPRAKEAADGHDAPAGPADAAADGGRPEVHGADGAGLWAGVRHALPGGHAGKSAAVVVAELVAAAGRQRLDGADAGLGARPGPAESVAGLILKEAGSNSTLPDGSVLDIDALNKRVARRKVEEIPLAGLSKPNRSSQTGYSKKRYNSVDMGKPVLVGHDGTLYDGRHRLSRHIDEGHSHIKARRVSDADLAAITICNAGDPIDKSRIGLLPEKAAVAIDLLLKEAADGTADAESATIDANRARPASRRPHDFEAAEWTHPNGHPRCIRCGDEESTGGRCVGSAARDADRRESRDAPKGMDTRQRRVAKHDRRVAKAHNPAIRAFGKAHGIDVTSILLPVPEKSAAEAAIALLGYG